jgi:hypothetical protein
MTLSRCANLTSTLRSLVVPRFLRSFLFHLLTEAHTYSSTQDYPDGNRSRRQPSSAHLRRYPSFSSTRHLCGAAATSHSPSRFSTLLCYFFFFVPLALFSLPILFFFSATSPHPQSHCNSDDLMITHFRSEACMCSCKPLTPLTSMRSKHVQHRIVSFYMAGVVEASRR